MLSRNYRSKVVHRTVACRAETENLNPGLEAWEFTCPYCDYRARYQKLSTTMAELEVWCQGDPLVRHHNSYASEQKEETWLTPEIRQQMESLLADVEID
jgi:hypothetical protein